MPRFHHESSAQTTPIFSSRRASNMPSMRRVKVFGILVFLFVVTLLFYTASQRQQGDLATGSDFYSKTKNALERNPVGGGSSTAGKGKQGTAGTGSSDEEGVAKAMAERLREAAQVAKDNANAKAPKPDPPSSVVGIGSAAEGAERGVAGRKKYNSGAEAQEPIKDDEQKKEDEAVQNELNSILKKAPIIIFSKSYCPHSAQAKGILLEKYLIEPKPYVVELDLHKIGAKLQAKLAELTGRRTVPNVLINGVAIGGGDDVAELDSSGKLIDKVKDLGGKRMTEVKLRPIEKTKETEKVVEEEVKHGL